MNIVKFVLAFLIASAIVNDPVTAQDVVERLKQYQVESVSQEFRSQWYFDITVLEESEEGKSFSETRWFGRQLNAGGGRVRMDYEKVTSYLDTVQNEREHYLRLSESERFYFLQIPGSQPQKVETKVGMQNCTVPYVSPWNFAVGGSSEIGRQKRDAVSNALDLFEKIGDRGFILKLRDGKGKGSVIRVFDFDAAHPWMIKRARTYVPGEDINLRFKKDINTVDPLQTIKDFKLMFDVSTEWTEVREIGQLPFRVHSSRQFFRPSDPSAKQEMKAYFFEYQFDEIDVDRFFDKERFDPFKFPEDFSLKAVDIEAKKIKSSSQK